MKDRPLGDPEFVIEALRRENADLKARTEEILAGMEWLVTLKLIKDDSGKTERYFRQMPKAWENAKRLLSLPTLGASTRLRDKHYRECEEIATEHKCVSYWCICNMKIAEEIDGAREGK